MFAQTFAVFPQFDSDNVFLFKQHLKVRIWYHSKQQQCHWYSHGIIIKIIQAFP